MEDRIPTPEEQIQLVDDARERMESRARSWLEDKTVKAALQKFDPADLEPRQAG